MTTLCPDPITTLAPIIQRILDTYYELGDAAGNAIINVGAIQDLENAYESLVKRVQSTDRTNATRELTAHREEIS